MSSQISKIVETAERYIGIKESPPNSNNVIFNTRYYGRAVSGPDLAWCCAFIWCLFQDIGAPGLFYGGGKTASCTTLMNWAKQNGLWVTSGYRRGDLALFDWSGQRKITQHIGIITSAGPGGIETVEGNTSMTSNDNGGAVMGRSRVLSLVTGAVRPKYEEDDIVTQEQFNQMMEKYLIERSKRSVADWAKNAWNKITKPGGIYTDNTNPQGFVTREQLALIFEKTGILK